MRHPSRLRPLPFTATAAALLVGAGLATTGGTAAAAEPWVDRPLTLPYHDWAFDFGLGVGHENRDPLPSPTGAGLNFEAAVGVTENVELGLRVGAGLSADARTMGYRPDAYGRLFDTETYNAGADTLTNPDFRVRWRFVHGSFAQVGLEGRVYLPFAEGTRIGIMAALPVQLRLGSVARLDTGIDVPVLFYDPTRTVVSIPARLWFQPTESLWLGPISALRIHNPGDNTSLLLGFGLGYQVASAVDLKFQVIFPRITDTEGARNVGGGAGIEVRIE